MPFSKSFCKSYHDLLLLCLNISDTTNIILKGADYSLIIHDISKSATYPLLENSLLVDCA